MDFQALKAQLEASRRLEVEVAGATFTLVIPPEHTWRRLFESNTDAMGRVLLAAAMRAVLAEAIVGWKDLTARHFLPDAPEEPVAYSPAAKAELLDVCQDISDVLAEEAAKRRRAQRDKREAIRKN